MGNFISNTRSSSQNKDKPKASKTGPQLVLDVTDNIEEEVVYYQQGSYSKGFKPQRSGHDSNQRQWSSLGRSQPRVCWSCGGQGHISRDCPSNLDGPDNRSGPQSTPARKGNQRKISKQRQRCNSQARSQQPICWTCGGRGHFSRDCPSH
uniref:CCHC-type domain-containing protein n=1 Tax=Nothobranchius pienaari TaxID=704102 RepID=A0A1A8NVT2_9TELE